LNYACGSGLRGITTDIGCWRSFAKRRNAAQSPAGHPGLSDASQKVAGSSASLFGYSNESRSTRVFFDTLKKDPDSINNLAGLAPSRLRWVCRT